DERERRHLAAEVRHLHREPPFLLQGVEMCQSVPLPTSPGVVMSMRTSARASATGAPLAFGLLLASPNFVKDIARLSSRPASGRHGTVLRVKASIWGASGLSVRNALER